MAYAFAPFDASFREHPETVVNAAFDYLRRSAMARMIIDGLGAQDKVITIQVGNNVEPKYRHPKIGETHGGIVEWNPGMALAVVDKATSKSGLQKTRPNVPWVDQNEERYGFLYLFKRRLDRVGQLSPAVALLHELGHAHQFFEDPTAYRAARNETLEDTNVAAIENTVCLELNEAGGTEGLRWDYNATA